MGYQVLSETTLRGPRGTIQTIKPGEMFGFINPEVFNDGRARRLQSAAIQDHGAGPFELKSIKYYPRNGYPLILMCFTDGNEKESEMNADFFTKAE